MTNSRISPDHCGLNTHNFPNGFEKDIHLQGLLTGLGVKWMRAEVSWFEIEKAVGQFDYTPVDRIVEFAQKHGIKILFILTKTPGFYGGGAHHNHLPGGHVERWIQFVRNTVEKYRVSIKHWNIWNEPNLTQFWDDSPENFIHRVLKPAFETIKSVDTEAKICGPELSSINANGSAKQWLRKITESGIRFDILTHHQYDGGDKPDGRFKEIIEFFNLATDIGYYKNTHLWVTETGWQGSKFNPQIIASYLQQMMEKIQHHIGGYMLKKIFWYSWRDSESGDQWGLLDPGNNPTPAYAKYKEFIKSLGSYTVV